MLILFFTIKAFGNNFFNLEELQELNLFFNKIENSFKISSNPELQSLFSEHKLSN